MRVATFLAFVASLRTIVLTLAQRVLVSVCFDGIDPEDLSASERLIAAELFGGVDRVAERMRGVVVWVKGARIGGTWLSSMRLLHLAMTLPLLTLAPGEQAFALIVAPDLRLARQALRYIAGAVEGNRKLAQRIVAQTADSLTLRRDDGRLVTFECLPATRGGSAVRGRSIVAALLSEAGFFRDEDFQVNDVDLYQAIAPRILPGGQIILESTPWGEMGLLHAFFVNDFGHPETALVAHCPTLVMRDDAQTREVVEREQERNPENAQREFGAQFLVDTMAAWPSADVAAAFTPHPGMFTSNRGFAWADPGESLDSFVMMAGAWLDPTPGTYYRQASAPPETGLSPDIFIGDNARDANGFEIEVPKAERRILRVFGLWSWPGPKVREMGMLRVVNEMTRILVSCGIDTLLSDQRGAPYLAALFSERRIKFRSFAMTSPSKHEGATIIRSLLRDRELSIAADLPCSAECRKQMAQYKRITQPGGAFKYSGGTRSAVDDWPAALVTLGVALLEERGTPASQTYFDIEGAPTKKTLGGRFLAQGRG